ncbi:hypothetical protein N7471_003664 [Penicillium samsonianum]|uniref:uncharacterized protein n=1 Tax=Penicillium samsonianum TaxID=1882272 RepID=UPI0025468BF6|nr:uncharacterized protein N7471_003664 [Penicillium samsonianum]KAJ6137178.1 hypothetical protein N7471_003664 [Penicillium samsonianum]
MVLESEPLGHRWRSSRIFILFVVILALFCETFLYSFPVPILSYMIEDRLHIDPSQTQNITTALLSLHGFIALISAPIIAHFADKSSSRKFPLLISLAGCFVGTVLLSLTPSVPALFAGRIIQGIAGSATWIIGSDTMTDHVEVGNLGKLYGLSMSFVSAGVVAGPAIAGTVLELAGYWPAWSVALGLLALDIIMRFIMIETPKSSSTGRESSTLHPSDTTASNSETSALLANDAFAHPPNTLDYIAKTHDEHTQKGGFYRIMLSDARVISGLSSTILSSSILASFDATLTLHLRDAFGWGSMAVGMMFLSLQLPSICLGSLAGWLRDRVGLRYPTAIGWTLFAPIMWLLGVPGSDKFPFGSTTNGEGLFIFAVIAFGVVTPLVRGAGYLQLSIVLNELQAQNPKVFGQHGGSNRVFALQDIALSLGLMIGPLISGSLTQAVGYYWMSCTLACDQK